MISLHQKIIPTHFDLIAIVWGEIGGQPKIKINFFSNERASATELADQIYPYAEIESCEQIDGIANKIVQFLNGEDIYFFFGNCGFGFY